MPETERRTSNDGSSVMSDLQCGELTDDAFLGGRLQILQPKRGYRAGIDAVFLAASVPANREHTVLELGAGVGVASLCLARRVPGVQITGLEIQTDLVAIAQENIARNDLQEKLTIIEGDLDSLPGDLNQRSFDHVVLNPPFYERESAVGAPNQSKFVSKIGTGLLLEDWIASALKRLKPNGHITVIHLAEQLDRLLACLESKTGKAKIYPLWPKQNSSASRVIVTATKGSAAPVCLLPGMMLHVKGGEYTPEANAVLREGKVCPIVFD